MNELLSLVSSFCRTCSSNLPSMRFSVSLISEISRWIDLNVMMVVCSAMVICRAKCSFHTRFCSASSRSLPRALRYLVCIGRFEEALAVVSYHLVERVLYKHERLVVLAQTFFQDVLDDVQGRKFFGFFPFFKLVVSMLD